MRMQKLWKALVILALLVVLFIPPIQRFMPTPLWMVLFIATLTYGISLFLSTEMPMHRRWGIAYLAFTGLTYLLAGLLGLGEGGFIEPQLWKMLISPYPLLKLLRHGIPRSPHAPEWAEIYVLPQDDHRLFAATVLAVSLLAIVAAFAMVKGFRTAYRAWLGLASLSTLATLGYVVMGFVRWGPIEAVLPVCWTASYWAAYVMARKGVDFKARSVPSQGNSSKHTKGVFDEQNK